MHGVLLLNIYSLLFLVQCIIAPHCVYALQEASEPVSQADSVFHYSSAQMKGPAGPKALESELKGQRPETSSASNTIGPVIDSQAAGEKLRADQGVPSSFEGSKDEIEIEVSRLATLEEAEALALKMRESGFKTVIRPAQGRGGAAFYSIFVVIHKDRSADVDVPPTNQVGLAGEKKDTWEILGRQSRMIYPSVSLTAAYTDNVFNSRSYRQSDFSLVLTPQLNIALPLELVTQASLNTWARSPGGIFLGRPDFAAAKSYNLLMLSADIPLTSSYSNLRGTGVISPRLTMGTGFTYGKWMFDVYDQFLWAYETRPAGGTAATGAVDRYWNNLLGAEVSFKPGSKTLLKCGYGRFMVRFDDRYNDFRERDDDAFSCSVFYKTTPKTSVFIEYNLHDIRYRSNSGIDSRENQIFGGVEWDVTPKLKSYVKAGYGLKTFSGTADKSRDILVEAFVYYLATPKSTIMLEAVRKTTESNVQNMDYSLTTEIKAALMHVFRPKKMTGSAYVSYTSDRYIANQSVSGIAGDRHDDEWRTGLAFDYEHTRWLKSHLGYFHTEHASNYSDFGYSKNNLFFRLTVSR